MPLFKDRNDTKEPAEEETLPAYSVLPPDAFNPIEGLIAPRRYQIQHDGYMKGARIWIVDSTSNPTSEAIDAPELSYDSKAPLDTDEKVDTNVKPEINAESSHSQPSGGQSSTQGSSKCKAKKYQKFKCIDPSTVPGHYYIKRAKWKMAGTLFEGPGPDDKFAGAKKLIDINGEGRYNYEINPKERAMHNLDFE
ncbi:hypothetical protein FRB90_002780 [Tulasnella sp. 427]|nr:hypothetical protein FRB90_002780 [Tulasnella sp. 427]